MNRRKTRKVHCKRYIICLSFSSNLDFICNQGRDHMSFQCSTNEAEYPKWGIIDVFKWKVLPARFGGKIAYIQNFKDAWVIHNKSKIQSYAKEFDLPAPLLAGVCWIEVAGDPAFIDRAAFEVRAFDWSGSDYIDRHFTLTRRPEKTSFGSVSMQVRTAAETLGVDPRELSTSEMRELSNCLEKDTFNIATVAQHLDQLSKVDGLTRPFSDDDIKIIGARYNRGSGLSLDKIKQNTSYGNFIVKYWPRFVRLLGK
jgi:hypothetical protein